MSQQEERGTLGENIQIILLLQVLFQISKAPWQLFHLSMARKTQVCPLSSGPLLGAPTQLHESTQYGPTQISTGPVTVAQSNFHAFVVSLPAALTDTGCKKTKLDACVEWSLAVRRRRVCFVWLPRVPVRNNILGCTNLRRSRQQEPVARITLV